MSNHSQGRGINYLAVLHTSEAYMADTVRKICKEEYGTKETRPLLWSGQLRSEN